MQFIDQRHLDESKLGKILHMHNLPYQRNKRALEAVIVDYSSFDLNYTNRHREKLIRQEILVKRKRRRNDRQCLVNAIFVHGPSRSV